MRFATVKVEDPANKRPTGLRRPEPSVPPRMSAPESPAAEKPPGVISICPTNFATPQPPVDVHCGIDGLNGPRGQSGRAAALTNRKPKRRFLQHGARIAYVEDELIDEISGALHEHGPTRSRVYARGGALSKYLLARAAGDSLE